MVNEDQQAYDRVRSKCGVFRINKRLSYTEDLAARLSALPGCLTNRLGAFLDTRHLATNKSQFARREWKVVFMRPLENALSGHVAQDQFKASSGFRVRKRANMSHPILQKWLVVIQGQVTMTSKDGFVTYDTTSNPWLAVDKQVRRHEES